MTGLNIAYLIFGTLGAFFAVLFSGNQLIKALKNKWLEDQDNTRAIRDNTAATAKATDAITTLTDLYTDLKGRVENLEHGGYNGGSTHIPERSP